MSGDMERGGGREGDRIIRGGWMRRGREMEGEVRGWGEGVEQRGIEEDGCMMRKGVRVRGRSREDGVGNRVG